MLNLTVIICFYNAEKYIEETLTAVCKQTFSDFNLMLVNDCSTDNTAIIAETYLRSLGKEYSMVEFDENQGIAYSRNFALSKAETKYLLFIDADDVPNEKLVELEYQKITSDSDLIGVSSWLQYIDEKGKLLKGKLRLGETSKDLFIEKASKGKRIFLPIHTMIDREKAVQAGGFCIDGFPEGKPRYRDYCEDLDLWTRMSDFYSEGKAFICIPQFLYKYRKIDGLSSNHFNMIIKMDYVKYNVRRRRQGLTDVAFIEYMDSLDPQYLAKLKRDSKSADDLRNGVFYLHRGNVIKAVGLVCRSIWNNPRYIVDKLRHNL